MPVQFTVTCNNPDISQYVGSKNSIIKDISVSRLCSNYFIKVAFKKYFLPKADVFLNGDV